MAMLGGGVVVFGGESFDCISAPTSRTDLRSLPRVWRGGDKLKRPSSAEGGSSMHGAEANVDASVAAEPRAQAERDAQK